MNETHNSTHTHLETYNIYSQTMMNDLTNNKTCMKQQQHEHAKSDNIHTQKHKEINRNECKKRQTQNKTEENARQRVSEVHSMTASLLGREHQGRSPTKQTINHISTHLSSKHALFYLHPILFRTSCLPVQDKLRFIRKLNNLHWNTITLSQE